MLPVYHHTVLDVSDSITLDIGFTVRRLYRGHTRANAHLHRLASFLRSAKNGSVITNLALHPKEYNTRPLNLSKFVVSITLSSSCFCILVFTFF